MEKRIFPVLGSAVLFVSLLSSSGAFAMGCPDFTGTFNRSGDSGRTITLTIQQSACDRASATYDYGNGIRFSRPMVFDGIQRTILSRSGLKVMEAYRWGAGEIRVTKETILDGANPPIQGNSRIYLDASKNLVEEPLGGAQGPGAETPTVYFRQ